MQLEVALQLSMAPIVGLNTTAADFLSRLGTVITEKIRPKKPKDFNPSPIEVTTFSSNATDGDQKTFTKADNDMEIEDQTVEGKKFLEKLRLNG